MYKPGLYKCFRMLDTKTSYSHYNLLSVDLQVFYVIFILTCTILYIYIRVSCVFSNETIILPVNKNSKWKQDISLFIIWLSLHSINS